ncbi:MAG: SAM-dependent methyltransferase [Gammaproteobacteria bacterium]|nr:SAM-dependent methyltransferase [Gammaproteobacteria bacterium]
MTVDINEVGTTAFVIACFRAMEKERARPLFEDPYAEWFVTDQAMGMARQLAGAVPESTHMLRFRTRFFNRFVERGIAEGARQVVSLGSGLDMRAQIFAAPRVTHYEVDQEAVVRYKDEVLRGHGITPCPALPFNYLEVDLPEKLAEAGFDLDAPTVIVWEGNTMYLPTETIFPFLNSLCARMSSFRIAFDYFAADLQERVFEREEDLKRIEAVERAMGASFPTGFEDLAVFEAETPLKVLESGPIGELGEAYGTDDIAENMAADEGLSVYQYGVLGTR